MGNFRMKPLKREKEQDQARLLILVFFPPRFIFILGHDEV